ncbi:hydrolase tropI-like [Teratosphaeria destructans]|uniref:Hydrolase tropI-like n=1 Tax=Teratosphaeria destructans TaxID=418781 RepID=A0A9W7SL47_9PEZI|nr:hydrolase tropI-like [Teratosphaeria destructans]
MSIKQCCATGSLHTGTPTGTTKQVHGLETYVAEAPNGNPKGIIVIIPDAFGIALPNNKILADEYAKRTNSTVYLPDFMNGICLPPEVLISFKAMSAPGLWNNLYKIGHFFYLMRYVPWFLWGTRRAVCGPRVFDFFKAVRVHEGANLPIGTAGFCWGGQWVTQLCWDQTRTDDGKRLVDAGFVAHPSMLTYPGDLELIVLPYSVAASEHDAQMSPAQAEMTKTILAAKTAKTKDQGVEHEFVMEEAERGKRAEDQAVAWFERWFQSRPPLAGARA